MTLSERHIQRQIVDYLRATGWLVIETYLGSSRGGSAWLTKGLPDLYAVRRGRQIWVEVKTPSGRVRPEQQTLHEQLRAQGAEVYVVRSIEHLREEVEG
jgi:Holliday junction resolvase